MERSELINWILKLQISAQSHHPYVRPSPSGDLKTNILVVTSPLLHLPPLAKYKYKATIFKILHALT